MRYKWLKQSENNKIIVFFNGWGMDETIVSHLECENYDVLMFYDYNNLNTEFDFHTLNNYNNKYLIAWSMGVMIATNFDINYTKKIAVNGTLFPIDDKFGIPNKIYELTIKGFNNNSLKKFVRNMFDSDEKELILSRNFEEQKSELVALKKYNANQNFKYDKIIISDNDKIIPTKNQVVFWNTQPNLKSGHAPFFKFKKWRDLL